MQIDPLTQSTLNLAGTLAARGCLALSRGHAVGVDLGRVRADGSTQAEAAAAHHEGALVQARVLLTTSLPGIAAQVVVHAGRMAIEATPFVDALVAECGDAAGRLAGLVLALPYQPAQAPGGFAMHPARVVACPPALEPLADELLQAFAQGMASMEPGYAAWMDALELESRTPPRPPADPRDADAFACAIHAADPQADSDAKAAAHLQAFLDHGRFEGGLGFEKALRTLTLDFSLASLEPLDALIDRLHAERRPRPDAFLGAQAGLNFLHLLAIYLGEVMAQAAGATVAWRTHAQLESVEPGRLDGESDAATALVCVFNGHGPRTGLVFLALDVVACRLFGQAEAPTLAAAAAAALPAIRAARRTDLPELGAVWARTRARDDLAIPRPHGVDADPLGRWFDGLPVLLQSGRVVWARVVQANTLLFRPGQDDHPGEVVYDPAGRADPDALDAVAERLYALKGTRPRNPSLAFIAAYLTHERTRTRGFPVPPGLGARGLLLSTLVFHRPHLPGARLGGLRFPVLIADAAPGVAMVLPAPCWPEAMRASWLG